MAVLIWLTAWLIFGGSAVSMPWLVAGLCCVGLAARSHDE